MTKLEQVIHLSLYPKANGKTYSAIHGLMGNDQAVMIVHSYQDGRRIASQYKISPRRFISMHELDSMRGMAKPVIIEPYALACMAEEALEEIKELREENEKLKIKVRQAK